MCTFHIVGGQWVGKAPPRPTPTLLLEPRTPLHEDGVHDRDAYHTNGVKEKTVVHGSTGADEVHLPERTIVTRGPAGSCTISITAVVAVANEMKVTRQSTRALTVSSRMSRRTRGGNDASAPQAVRSFLLKMGPWQGQPTDESQYYRISKTVEIRKQ